MSRVLIVPAPLFHQPGRHIEILRGAGFEIAYPSEKKAVLSEAEIIASLSGVSAVIAGSEPYNDRVLAAAKQLRVVSRAGVGSDAVVADAATRHNVAVTITPGTNHDAVAETALAMLFALARSVVRLDRQVRAGFWPREPLEPIRGKTLGIVGFGRIGRSVAVRAAAFGLSMLVCEALPDHELLRKLQIQLVDLPTLLAESHFVTLHVPLGPTTRGLINRDTLALMRPGSILINTARGGLVVEADLYDALRSGHLAAAGLDVFEHEPASGNRLLELDNVLASPHVAGVDTQSLAEMACMAAQNIVDLASGRWPESCLVNPDVRQTWKW